MKKKFFFLSILLSIYFKVIMNQTNNTSYSQNCINENFFKIKEGIIDFFSLCSNGVNLYNKNFQKNDNPKFSLIIPVLNQKNNLIKVIKSIQNQPYQNIEIIFIDDCSTDGSDEIISKFMENDKRIILIKHNINKGTFITRNDGVLAATGKYILFIDPDDMFLRDSFLKFNNAIEKYPNVDIIQFRTYRKLGNSIRAWSFGQSAEKILKQPELSYIMFYRNDRLKQYEYYLWNKIIKRKVLLEAINKLGDYYKNQYMTLYEDGAMLFLLLNTAESYVYMRFYGYLYCINYINHIQSRYKLDKVNRTIKNIFLFAEFLFDFSKNELKHKMCAIFHLKRIYNKYYFASLHTTEGFDYIFKVLNKMIKYDVYTYEEKFIIKDIINIFRNIQMKLN